MEIREKFPSKFSKRKFVFRSLALKDAKLFCIMVTYLESDAQCMAYIFAK